MFAHSVVGRGASVLIIELAVMLHHFCKNIMLQCVVVIHRPGDHGLHRPSVYTMQLGRRCWQAVLVDGVGNLTMFSV